MSSRIPPGFAEMWVAFSTTGDNELMYTSLGVDLSPGETVTVARVNEFRNRFLADFANNLSSAYDLEAGHAIVGQDGGDLRVDGTEASDPFTGTASALPQNCAFLIKKGTALGGRRGRGRMFIPGAPEADVDSVGALTSGALAALQTDFNSFLIAVKAFTWVDELVLFHDTAPFDPTPIVSLVVDQRIATQRRRLRR